MHQIRRSVSLALALAACMGAGTASAQSTASRGDAGRGSYQLMLIDGLVDYNQMVILSKMLPARSKRSGDLALDCDKGTVPRTSKLHCAVAIDVSGDRTPRLRETVSRVRAVMKPRGRGGSVRTTTYDGGPSEARKALRRVLSAGIATKAAAGTPAPAR